MMARSSVVLRCSDVQLLSCATGAVVGFPLVVSCFSLRPRSNATASQRGMSSVAELGVNKIMLCYLQSLLGFWFATSSARETTVGITRLPSPAGG